MHARALAYELQAYAPAIITRSTGLRPTPRILHDRDLQ